MFCNNEYDVVVIGAGPGGSVAARNLSRAGHKVLLLEKREKIGYPVRCGEASTKLSDLQTYGPIDEDCIETIINGLYIYGPNGVNIDLSQKGTGIMLNREKFDPWLAHLAANDGVELVTRARAEFVGDVESGTRLVRVKLGDGAGDSTEEVRWSLPQTASKAASGAKSDSIASKSPDSPAPASISKCKASSPSLTTSHSGKATTLSTTVTSGVSRKSNPTSRTSAPDF